MVTYKLFKTHSMLWSATKRKDQPAGDLQPVQKQSMLLSAINRKSQIDGDIHPVQQPEHAHVNNKEEGPTGC